MATRSVAYDKLSLGSVLVATDFSPASDRALRHAISIARHYRALLCVVHVVSSLGCTLAGPDAVQLALDVARREMGNLEDRLLRDGQLQGLEHRFAVLDGNLDEALSRFARENRVDLIVAGTHAKHGFKKLIFGSIARLITRCCCCPVLTVGPHSPLTWDWTTFDRPSSLLYATAFQCASRKVLPYAVSLANESQSQLTLLHVLSPDLWHEAGAGKGPSNIAEVSAIQHLKELIPPNAELKHEAAFIVEHGDPASSILKVAARTRPVAIIMGSRPEHFSDVTSRFLPSTVHRVSCEAQCPVLTIRG